MIVDSSAVVAILTKEPEAPALTEALRSAKVLHISAVNLLESHLVMRGRYGEAGVARASALVQELGVRVLAADEEQALIASEAHRVYGRGSGHRAKLNFGDCFAYALAKTRNEPLLCKGDDFVHTDVELAVRP